MFGKTPNVLSKTETEDKLHEKNCKCEGNLSCNYIRWCNWVVMVSLALYRRTGPRKAILLFMYVCDCSLIICRSSIKIPRLILLLG